MTTFSLFIGAFLDALIGPNLFVPGEPFLISAGYQLHQGALIPVFAVLLGGFLGDQISYFIGLKYGHTATRKLIRFQPKVNRVVARCRLLMRKKGNYVLIFARLLGPVAWVVPFIAGTNRIAWQRFTAFSTIGLVLGVGQFVFWGYCLSYGLDNIPVLNTVKLFFIDHQYSILIMSVVGLFFYIGIKYQFRFLILKSIAVLLLGVLFTNYSYFFMDADDFPLQTSVLSSQPVNRNNITFKAYPGSDSSQKAQAINVMLIGAHPIQLMNTLGWIENKTFSQHDLEWFDYLALLKANTPPVSDLFWQNRPQELAFQQPGSLLRRNHIRWWHSGIDSQSQQSIWLGAISYDIGLKVTPYAGVITILHRIDPDVDKQRNLLASQVTSSLPNSFSELVDTNKPISLDDQHDYFSDGRVLIINKNKENSAEQFSIAYTGDQNRQTSLK